MGMVSLRNSQDRIVNGQLSTFGITLLLLLLLWELLWLLLLTATVTDRLRLSNTTTVWAVRRRRICETATRTANTTATVVTSARWSSTLPRTFRYPTVAYRCMCKTNKTTRSTTRFDGVTHSHTHGRASGPFPFSDKGGSGDIKCPVRKIFKIKWSNNNNNNLCSCCCSAAVVKHRYTPAMTR